MYVINQPWDGPGQRLGDHIARLLTEDKPRFEVFRACVAYAKASGILRLAPSLKAFMDRGGMVEIAVGVDGGITTSQALELIMEYSTTAYVFNNPATTFHPKMYFFELPEKLAIAFVGSSNLTCGGLYTNYEANLGMALDLTVAADRETYESILSAFINASDTSAGNAKELDAALLQELRHGRKLADERHPRGMTRARKRTPVSGPPVFPRLPVPPPPRIDAHLAELVPRIGQRGDAEAVQEARATFQSWDTFTMVLGTRDTRQETGYSRDVFIPLAARDSNQQFWGWPSSFETRGTATTGNYTERRIDMLVRPVDGHIQVVAGARLYDYDIKHEFRLNCGRLIDGAKPGDILVIQKSPGGTIFEGHAYEFEATVIPSGHPGCNAFDKACRNEVPRSTKRWGYA